MRLLEIREKDYPFISKLTSDANLMKYIKNGKPWTSEKAKEFVNYCVEDSKLSHKERDQYWYLIETDSDIIGMIGFEKHKDNNYYLRVIIMKKYQGKGYFTKALDLVKNRLKNYKGVDKLYAEAHLENTNMNKILKSKYYYQGRKKYGRIVVNTYIIYIRVYTYLVLSDYIPQKTVDKLFKERGNWQVHNMGTCPDYIRLDGKYYYDRKYDKYTSILKNIINDEKKRITEKSRLFKNLGNKSYIPQSFTFKYFEEFKKISQKLISDDKAWIFKPDKAYAGEGIFILKKKDFPKIKFSPKPYWTMQEYVEDPYLIDGKKFHLRVIYLYRPKENGFMFKYVPLYLAKKDFVLDKFYDLDIHLSHYSKEQKPLYLHDLELTKMQCFNIIESIRKIILDLNNELKKASCYPDSQRCYEIFGIDLMLTKNLDVKLLEVNSKLGFKEFSNDDTDFNSKLLSAELSITVDHFLPAKNKDLKFDSNFLKI